MSRSPGTLLTGLLAAALVVPAASHASTGGATPTAGTPSAPAPSQPAPSGGVRAGDRSIRPPRPSRPVLARFDVSGRHSAVRVSFEIRARVPRVPVRLVVRRPGGAVVRTIDLGRRPTRSAQTARLTGLPEGALEIAISAPRLRRGARVSAVQTVELRGHRFPLLGPFTYGGDGSRFGADRGDHSHQGQDLAAASGTPIVAPRGGVIEHVGYQASSAGHYAVLDGDGEDRHYVFMHMLTGSVAVRQGQRVRIGQAIGQVGNTGRSTGPHLHFEIWVGGWYRGGHPIDPLPLLRRWDSWS